MGIYYNFFKCRGFVVTDKHDIEELADLDELPDSIHIKFCDNFVLITIDKDEFFESIVFNLNVDKSLNDNSDDEVYFLNKRDKPDSEDFIKTMNERTLEVLRVEHFSFPLIEDEYELAVLKTIIEDSSTYYGDIFVKTVN